MSNKLGGIEILVDGVHGIYVPQSFAERYADSWENIMPEDIATLLEGPDHAEYWEAWDSVLDMAQRMDGDYRYTLHQDGDLFAVCDARISLHQYQMFFGY